MGLDEDVVESMNRDVTMGGARLQLPDDPHAKTQVRPEVVRERERERERQRERKREREKKGERGLYAFRFQGQNNFGAKRTLIKQPPPKRAQRQFERMWNVSKPGGNDDDGDDVGADVFKK